MGKKDNLTKTFDRKITGIVLPADWDEKGSIKSIMISTSKEEEFLVIGNEVAKKLMKHLRHEVEVEGLMRDNTIQKSIAVKTFSVKKSENL